MRGKDDATAAASAAAAAKMTKTTTTRTATMRDEVISDRLIYSEVMAGADRTSNAAAGSSRDRVTVTVTGTRADQ